MANQFNLLKYYHSPDQIDWRFLDKDTYQEIEDIFTKDVKIFDPFLVDKFFDDDTFEELKDICHSHELSKIDYSNQMNKWEQNLQIPKKFEDLAVKKLKDILKIEDAQVSYTMYAHHQITSDGRVPRLPLHIDWAPGAYMIDLQIGGNRDWGFVAKYENFICKENQAVICQPQFDYHYRPSWNSNNPQEYYQAIFFHIVNKDHWVNDGKNSRSEYLNNKYSFGPNFRNTEIFAKFQEQRNYIFQDEYVEHIKKINLPMPPFDEAPTETDTHIHSRRGIVPMNNGIIK